jgi:hypothetical protein
LQSKFTVSVTDQESEMPSHYSIHRSTSLRLATASVVVTVLFAMLTSCSSGPSRIAPPSINASAAGAAAMDQYDTNGDGRVAGEELDRAPGLKAALGTLDQDGDDAVTAEEVTARVEVWQGSRTGLTTVPCLVLLDGRPLGGAQLIFEPESFLGDELRTAIGTTNPFGKTSPTVPKEDRPAPDTPAGLPLGLYKVRISRANGGRETIPPRYNAETVLGQEVSFDVPEIINNRVIFNLKSN